MAREKLSAHPEGQDLLARLSNDVIAFPVNRL
jgi:hypothetical protein